MDAGQPAHRLSRLLTGACIEDVNHEIYGGIYSQMIFGESFQEPPASFPPRDFKVFGGQWRVRGEELHYAGAPGDKLVSELAPFADGEVGVEVFIADRNWSNAGLLVRAANAGPGTDHFDGYEISLNAAGQSLRLGRHRQNWEPIKDTPCTVPVGQWSALVVKLEKNVLEVSLNGRSIIRHEDGAGALLTGTVGLRAFQNEARYRNLWVKIGGQSKPLPFVASATVEAEVSGMWRPLQRGNPAGLWAVTKERPFTGAQSQHVSFAGGSGEVGVENQGLNRWGLHFAGGKTYEGLLWARAEKPSEVWVALESANGARVQAEKRLRLKAGDWQRLGIHADTESHRAQGAVRRQAEAARLGHAGLRVPAARRVGPIQGPARAPRRGRGADRPGHHRAALRRLDGQSPRNTAGRR